MSPIEELCIICVVLSHNRLYVVLLEQLYTLCCLLPIENIRTVYLNLILYMLNKYMYAHV